MIARLLKRGRSEDSTFSGLPPLRVDTQRGETLVDLTPELVSIYRRWYTYLGRETTFPRRLGLVSAIHGEGVTSVAIGLAAVMASDLEARIALVECNWWRPGLAAATHLEPVPGLAEVVTGKAALEDALRPCSLPNLVLLPAGELSECDWSRMARSTILADIIARLDQRFDHLILDIPAILAVKDSPVLAGLAGDLCLIVRQGVTPLGLIKKALDEIEHLALRGAILNGMNAHLGKIALSGPLSAVRAPLPADRSPRSGDRSPLSAVRDPLSEKGALLPRPARERAGGEGEPPTEDPQGFAKPSGSPKADSGPRKAERDL